MEIQSIIKQAGLTCSVVITTYNGEKYIIEQIESILNQTVLPDEIIISDDNSSDNTVLLIKDFMKKDRNNGVRIQLLLNDNPQKGVNQNIGNAIEHTSSDIVLLCDQDDIWCNDKIEVIKEAFLEYPEMELLVHDADYLIQNSDGKFQLHDKSFYQHHSCAIGYYIGKQRVAKLQREMFINKVITGNLINGMCMAVNREFIRSIMPFPELGYFDWWILLCSIINDSCFAINKVLAYYRIHANNLVGIEVGDISKKKKSFLRNINRLIRIKKHINNSEKYVKEEYEWARRVEKQIKLANYESISPHIIDSLSFMQYRRVRFLTQNKIAAIKNLSSAFKLYCDSVYTKPYHINDVAFVMLRSKRYRVRFSNSIIMNEVN